jgi:hypothetical protein
MSLGGYLFVVSIPTILAVVIALFIGTPSHHNTFLDPSATMEEHKMKMAERRYIPFSVPWVIVYIGLGLSLIVAIALPILYLL